jgi:hypothetical protein
MLIICRPICTDRDTTSQDESWQQFCYGDFKAGPYIFNVRLTDSVDETLRMSLDYKTGAAEATVLKRCVAYSRSGETRL